MWNVCCCRHDVPFKCCGRIAAILGIIQSIIWLICASMILYYSMHPELHTKSLHSRYRLNLEEEKSDLKKEQSNGNQVHREADYLGIFSGIKPKIYTVTGILSEITQKKDLLASTKYVSNEQINEGESFKMPAGLLFDNIQKDPQNCNRVSTKFALNDQGNEEKRILPPIFIASEMLARVLPGKTKIEQQNADRVCVKCALNKYDNEKKQNLNEISIKSGNPSKISSSDTLHNYQKPIKSNTKICCILKDESIDEAQNLFSVSLTSEMPSRMSYVLATITTEISNFNKTGTQHRVEKIFTLKFENKNKYINLIPTELYMNHNRLQETSTSSEVNFEIKQPKNIFKITKPSIQFNSTPISSNIILQVPTKFIGMKQLKNILPIPKENNRDHFRVRFKKPGEQNDVEQQFNFIKPNTPTAKIGIARPKNILPIPTKYNRGHFTVRFKKPREQKVVKQDLNLITPDTPKVNIRSKQSQIGLPVTNRDPFRMKFQIPGQEHDVGQQLNFKIHDTPTVKIGMEQYNNSLTFPTEYNRDQFRVRFKNLGEQNYVEQHINYITPDTPAVNFESKQHKNVLPVTVRDPFRMKFKIPGKQHDVDQQLNFKTHDTVTGKIEMKQHYNGLSFPKENNMDHLRVRFKKPGEQNDVEQRFNYISPVTLAVNFENKKNKNILSVPRSDMPAAIKNGMKEHNSILSITTASYRDHFRVKFKKPEQQNYENQQSYFITHDTPTENIGMKQNKNIFIVPSYGIEQHFNNVSREKPVQKLRKVTQYQNSFPVSRTPYRDHFRVKFNKHGQKYGIEQKFNFLTPVLRLPTKPIFKITLPVSKKPTTKILGVELKHRQQYGTALPFYSKTVEDNQDKKNYIVSTDHHKHYTRRIFTKPGLKYNEKSQQNDIGHQFIVITTTIPVTERHNVKFTKPKMKPTREHFRVTFKRHKRENTEKHKSVIAKLAVHKKNIDKFKHQQATTAIKSWVLDFMENLPTVTTDYTLKKVDRYDNMTNISPGYSKPQDRPIENSTSDKFGIPIYKEMDVPLYAFTNIFDVRTKVVPQNSSKPLVTKPDKSKDDAFVDNLVINITKEIDHPSLTLPNSFDVSEKVSDHQLSSTLSTKTSDLIAVVKDKIQFKTFNDTWRNIIKTFFSYSPHYISNDLVLNLTTDLPKNSKSLTITQESKGNEILDNIAIKIFKEMDAPSHVSTNILNISENVPERASNKFAVVYTTEASDLIAAVTNKIQFNTLIPHFFKYTYPEPMTVQPRNTKSLITTTDKSIKNGILADHAIKINKEIDAPLYASSNVSENVLERNFINKDAVIYTTESSNPIAVINGKIQFNTFNETWRNIINKLLTITSSYSPNKFSIYSTPEPMTVQPRNNTIFIITTDISTENRISDQNAVKIIKEMDASSYALSNMFDVFAAIHTTETSDPIAVVKDKIQFNTFNEVWKNIINKLLITNTTYSTNYFSNYSDPELMTVQPTHNQILIITTDQSIDKGILEEPSYSSPINLDESGNVPKRKSINKFAALHTTKISYPTAVVKNKIQFNKINYTLRNIINELQTSAYLPKHFSKYSVSKPIILQPRNSKSLIKTSDQTIQNGLLEKNSSKIFKEIDAPSYVSTNILDVSYIPELYSINKYVAMQTTDISKPIAAVEDRIQYNSFNDVRRNINSKFLKYHSSYRPQYISKYSESELTTHKSKENESLVKLGVTLYKAMDAPSYATTNNNNAFGAILITGTNNLIQVVEHKIKTHSVKNTRKNNLKTHFPFSPEQESTIVLPINTTFLTLKTDKTREKISFESKFRGNSDLPENMSELASTKQSSVIVTKVRNVTIEVKNKTKPIVGDNSSRPVLEKKNMNISLKSANSAKDSSKYADPTFNYFVSHYIVSTEPDQKTTFVKYIRLYLPLMSIWLGASIYLYIMILWNRLPIPNTRWTLCSYCLWSFVTMAVCTLDLILTIYVLYDTFYSLAYGHTVSESGSYEIEQQKARLGGIVSLFVMRFVIFWLLNLFLAVLLFTALFAWCGEWYCPPKCKYKQDFCEPVCGPINPYEGCSSPPSMLETPRFQSRSICDKNYRNTPILKCQNETYDTSIASPLYELEENPERDIRYEVCNENIPCSECGRINWESTRDIHFCNPCKRKQKQSTLINSMESGRTACKCTPKTLSCHNCTKKNDYQLRPEMYTLYSNENTSCKGCRCDSVCEHVQEEGQYDDNSCNLRVRSGCEVFLNRTKEDNQCNEIPDKNVQLSKSNDIISNHQHVPCIRCWKVKEKCIHIHFNCPGCRKNQILYTHDHEPCVKCIQRKKICLHIHDKCMGCNNYELIIKHKHTPCNICKKAEKECYHMHDRCESCRIIKLINNHNHIPCMHCLKSNAECYHLHRKCAGCRNVKMILNHTHIPCVTCRKNNVDCFHVHSYCLGCKTTRMIYTHDHKPCTKCENLQKECVHTHPNCTGCKSCLIVNNHNHVACCECKKMQMPCTHIHMNCVGCYSLKNPCNHAHLPCQKCADDNVACLHRNELCKGCDSSGTIITIVSLNDNSNEEGVKIEELRDVEPSTECKTKKIVSRFYAPTTPNITFKVLRKFFNEEDDECF